MSSLTFGNISHPNTCFIKTNQEFAEIPSIQASALNYLSTTKKAEGVTRFVFVRHGQSKSNQKNGVAGRTDDSELSTRGVEQTFEVGEKLAKTGITFDAAYSSPSIRAVNTGENILKVLNSHLKKPEPNKELYEKFYGPFEGATEEEYKETKEKEIAELPTKETFTEKFAYKSHPEMESHEEVHVRICSFMQELLKKEAGKDVLLTSHNGVLKSLFMAQEAQYNLSHRDFDLDNCAIVVVTVDANGEMQVAATEGITFKKSK